MSQTEIACERQVSEASISSDIAYLKPSGIAATNMLIYYFHSHALWVKFPSTSISDSNTTIMLLRNDSLPFDDDVL
jgi:hypothetical protein